MRFHHSTRRRGARSSQGATSAGLAAGPGARGQQESRCAQLSYCRLTNIHFNRRHQIEPPSELRAGEACAEELRASGDEMLGVALFDEPAGRQQREWAPCARVANDNQAGELIAAAHKQQVAGGALETDVAERDERASCEPQLGARLAQLELGCGAQQQQAPDAPRFSGQQQLARAGHTNEHAAKVDIESAREKLIAQVEKHPFWSNKAAKRMRLLDVSERQIYIYELVSFCERRDLEWRFEPYRGFLATSSGAAAAAGESAPAGAQLSRQQSLAAAAAPEQRRQSPPPSPAAEPPGQAAPASSLDCDGSAPLAQQQAPLGRHQLFSFGGGELARQRSLVHRASSHSAHSSPVRAAGADARRAPDQQQQQAGADEWQGAQPLGLATSSCPVERALPSAHFVWSIEPRAGAKPAPFKPSVHNSELPQSSFIKRCHGCAGRGRFKCNTCYGVGYEVCLSCSGRGNTRYLGLSATARHGSAGAPSRAAAAARDSAADGERDPAAASCSSSSPFAARRRDEPGGICQQSAAAWQSDSCHLCHGAGQKRCWICAGRAYQTCTACAGTGQLRCYLNLNITWLNHRDEFVLNNSDALIPRDRLKLCSGLVLLDRLATRLQPLESSFALYAADLDAAASSLGQQRQQPRAGRGQAAHQLAGQPPPPPAGANKQPSQQQVAPLSQLIKPNELNQLHSISSKLLERHQLSFASQQRMLKQRHKVTKVECFVVNWEWKRRRGHFVIYGHERKVYIPKYPFKSICSIT